MSGPTTTDPSPAASPEPAPPRAERVFKTVCRTLLAAVFLVAALSKVTDLRGFTDHLVMHSGLPYLPARFAAALVPWLELVCGLCLALGVAVREAAAVLTVMLVAFLAYTALHPSESDCGCMLFPDAFRAANEWPWPLVRNGVLFVCAISVAWESKPRRKRRDPAATSSVPPAAGTP